MLSHLVLVNTLEYVEEAEDESSDEDDDSRPQFPNEPLQKLNINWMSAINIMTNGGKITEAGVYDLESGTPLIQTQNLHPTPQEIFYIANLHDLKDATGQNPPTLDGATHRVLRFGIRSMVTAKPLVGGFVSVKTRKAVLIGKYVEPQNAVLGAQILEKLGREFYKNGI